MWNSLFGFGIISSDKTQESRGVIATLSQYLEMQEARPLTTNP